MNTLEQLRADYEALGQRIAELEKTEQDPWEGMSGYWYCSYHQGEVFLTNVEHHLTTCCSYGEAFLTREEAEHHMRVREAQTRVTNRIAEINREEGWKWVRGCKYCVAAYASDLGKFEAAWWRETVFAAPEHRGCQRAIETVIAEMPDALNLIYGVEK